MSRFLHFQPFWKENSRAQSIPQASIACNHRSRPDHFACRAALRDGQVDEKVLTGLDIRGDGGQIIAAPSKGRRWKNWGTPIALAPQWLIDEILRVSGGGPEMLKIAKGPRT